MKPARRKKTATWSRQAERQPRAVTHCPVLSTGRHLPRGMLAPVSSLSGGARVIGLAFPSSWYQQISVGVFAKALGFADLWRSIAALAVIALVFLGLSLMLLRKKEA